MLRNERGSAVIIAVMAMLIMGVLSVSFALLGDIESRVGVNYKQQAQAEAVAEAGLERARDAVRTAVTQTGGFSNWLNGPTATHLLFAGQPLGSAQYAARIDNDCPPIVPTAIRESAACNNTTDTNQVAVLTAWSTAGNGRARVRAIIGVDNPWKHVCSDAKPDNNGYCNDPANRNGSPTVTPADPNDPNGPNSYNTLPYPTLGCSRIAPGLHRGAQSLAAQIAGCTANPGMYGYPYPVPFNSAPRFVVMGEDPALVPAAKTCTSDGVHFYFGYFDCALSTPCDPVAGMACGGPAVRKACVPAGDLRWSTDSAHFVKYDLANGYCGGGGADETGMVFLPAGQPPLGGGPWPVGGNVSPNGNIGSQLQLFTVYVMGTLSQGNNRQYYGTFAVEGNTNDNWCADKDFQMGNGAASAIWSGPPSPTPLAGWTSTLQYGFPIAVLVYNPDEAPPTVQPTYAPQGTCADLGSNNSTVHGMVYSGGHVQFNPLSFDGTVVAFEIQTQGSATYNYNTWYGNNTPPSGFPIGSNNQVTIIRKSFVVCANYSDDTAAATTCN